MGGRDFAKMKDILENQCHRCILITLYSSNLVQFPSKATSYGNMIPIGDGNVSETSGLNVDSSATSVSDWVMGVSHIYFYEVKK